MPTEQEIRQSLLALSPGTRYLMRVRSVDGLSNKSDWSEGMEFDTASGGSYPSHPSGVSVDWTGRDLLIKWDVVSSTVDDLSIDVDKYELNIVLPGSTLDRVLTHKYILDSTSFTYTPNQMVGDFQGPLPTTITFFILPITSGGTKAKLDTSSEEAYNAQVYTVSHTHDTTPRVPYVESLGQSLLIAMDPGPSCHTLWNIQRSNDGGATYATIAAAVVENPYVYSPDDSGLYYIKYRRNCIYNVWTPMSNVGYGDVRSIWKSFTTDTDDFNGSNTATVTFPGPITAGDGVGTALIRITPDVTPTASFCKLTFRGTYDFNIPMVDGSTYYSLTLPAQLFAGTDVDFVFYLEDEVGGHAEVTLTTPT